MKQIKFSKFFEWYFSDVNGEGISIEYSRILNNELFDIVNVIFYRCVVVPAHLLDEGGGGELKVGTEVILVKDEFDY